RARCGAARPCPRPNRCPPTSNRSAPGQPAEMDREPLAVKEGHGLIERQADDIGVGADQPHDEAAGEPLDGVAAGLALPFSGSQITVDVLMGEPLEAHPSLDQALA